MENAHIVNINSIFGHVVRRIGPDVRQNVYPSTKHGITALNEVLRLELNAMRNAKIKISVRKLLILGAAVLWMHLINVGVTCMHVTIKCLFAERESWPRSNGDHQHRQFSGGRIFCTNASFECRRCCTWRDVCTQWAATCPHTRDYHTASWRDDLGWMTKYVGRIGVARIFTCTMLFMQTTTRLSAP